MSFEPIAIIGMSCVMPGALTPQELWENSLNKVNSLIIPSVNQWGVDPQNYLASLETAKGSYTLPSITTGCITNFESVFDPTVYQIAPEEILKMDKMYSWLLHTAREALMEAGYLEQVANLNINTIFGNLSYPTDALCQLAESIWLRQQQDPFWHSLVKQPDVLNRQMSGYPAHFLLKGLGLKGKGYALDAACASSLYAVKLACDDLHAGRADLVLAGGVSAASDFFVHIGFYGLHVLSHNGESLPLSTKASGLVPSQGCGFLVLKKLSRALADEDTILALIRGIGLSNDGNSGGLLMPAVSGQLQAIDKAYKGTQVNPESISFIECHATGTVVGDAIEVKSIHQFFKKNQGLALSSLKGNIGHALTASGVGSLIRTVKALNHQMLPPTLGAEEPLPLIKEYGLNLLTDAQPWRVGAGEIRRAGVNAFGLGGTNAHVILEEYSEHSAPAFTTTFIKKIPEIAVVGIGIVTAHTKNSAEFAEYLQQGIKKEAHKIADIELPITELLFTPLNLRSAQGEQLGILKTALEAHAQIKKCNVRTNVIIGMQCDPSSVSMGLQWRLKELLHNAGVDVNQEWLDTAKRHLGGALNAEQVLGAMPNIIANRLNVQWNYQEASYSVSDEELSGLTAMRLGIDSLIQYESDMAIIGAADFCMNEIDTELVPKLLNKPDLLMGDVAVVLILKRLSDALLHKETIYAVLSDKNESTVQQELDQFSLQEQFGYAHTASGLLAVAASALSCYNAAPTPFNSLVKVKTFSEQTGALCLKNYIDASRFSYKAKAENSGIAYIFASSNTIYPKVGESLIKAYPEFVEIISKRYFYTRENIYGVIHKLLEDKEYQYANFLINNKLGLIVSIYHYLYCKEVLGLNVKTIIGHSAGEEIGWMTTEARPNTELIEKNVLESGIYDNWLDGEYKILDGIWPESLGKREWGNYRIVAPYDEVKALVDRYELCGITLINTLNDVVVSGPPQQCMEIFKQLGVTNPMKLLSDVIVHKKMTLPIFQKNSILPEPINTEGGFEFYSCVTGLRYEASAENFQHHHELIGTCCVDFPRVINNAYEQGIRTFIEIGSRGVCTEWVHKILGDKPHTAVSCDRSGVDALVQIKKMEEELYRAGILERKYE